MADPDTLSVVATIAIWGMVLGLLVVSLRAGAWLLQRLFTTGVVLSPEPRRPVPWGLGIAGLVIAWTAMGVISAVQPPEAEPAASVLLEAVHFWELVGGYLVLAAGAIGLLVFGCGATRMDLGWPTSARGWREDMVLGGRFAVASLIPVYLVQVAAIYGLGISSTHPLLDQLQQQLRWDLVLSAAVLAVFVAPIMEEILYRLVLQGGLESWEERGQDAIDASGARAIAQARVRWLGLPAGWLPILVSSFCFALAHLGHGPSPVPLFVFALFLGYLYQRTHRIVPSIAAHLVFNLISLILALLSSVAK